MSTGRFPRRRRSPTHELTPRRWWRLGVQYGRRSRFCIDGSLTHHGSSVGPGSPRRSARRPRRDALGLEHRVDLGGIARIGPEPLPEHQDQERQVEQLGHAPQHRAGGLLVVERARAPRVRPRGSRSTTSTTWVCSRRAMPGTASSTSSNEPIASDSPTASELRGVIGTDERKHDQRADRPAATQLLDPAEQRHVDRPARQRPEEQHHRQQRHQRRADQRIAEQPHRTRAQEPRRASRPRRARPGQLQRAARPGSGTARRAAARAAAPSTPRTASRGTRRRSRTSSTRAATSPTRTTPGRRPAGRAPHAGARRQVPRRAAARRRSRPAATSTRVTSPPSGVGQRGGHPSIVHHAATSAPAARAAHDVGHARLPRQRSRRFRAQGQAASRTCASSATSRSTAARTPTTPQDDYPPPCIAAGRTHGGRPGQPRRRDRRLGQRRADRGQQGRGRARRAGLERRDRPARPRAQRRQRHQHRRPRPSRRPTRCASSSIFLATPFSEAARHVRRIADAHRVRDDRRDRGPPDDLSARRRLGRRGG